MLKDKIKKGVFAPSYYNEFKCTADKCQHSCCIDWEICIDGEAYEKYKHMDDIFDSIDECEDGPCFALREDGRCPHLNDVGLCNIIISHGEESLCEICQNHPRFYNFVSAGRTEAGLGIVCEEACRLILENEKPFSLVQIDEFEECFDVDTDFDALPQRSHIISMIEANGRFEEKLAKLKMVFNIPELYTLDKWINRFLSLEILDPAWEHDLHTMQENIAQRHIVNTEQYDKYYERLLTYFVYRHVSTAESEENLRARLAFCILSLEVIRVLFECSAKQTLTSLVDWARRYSAEIEYSEDNTEELIFAFESGIL